MGATEEQYIVKLQFTGLHSIHYIYIYIYIYIGASLLFDKCF